MTLVNLAEFNPRTIRQDRAARLARMAAHAKPDPAPRPFLVRFRPAISAPPAPIDEDVAERHPDGTVSYRHQHGPERRPTLAMRSVIVAAARHYGVDPSDLRGLRKTADVVRPRQLAFYVGIEVLRRPTKEVGRCLGGRDHSTAMFGRDRIKARLARGDLETTAALAAVLRKLGIEVTP
jgi:hypothetical protein